MPFEDENKITKNNSYTCTECPSQIEIYSINNIDIKITFKCLNKDINNNHGKKSMLIKDYLREMEKNTRFFGIKLSEE